MIDIETNTIVKNCVEFIQPCLEQVLPFVKTARVSVQDDSSDGTKEILENMAQKYSNLVLSSHGKDLVKARNNLLQKTTSKWVWILDDDEYYPINEIETLFSELEIKEQYSCISIPFFLIVNENEYQRKRSVRADRIFKNSTTLSWNGLFGKERICRDDIPVCSGKRTFKSRAYYIHLSLFKKHSWREEFNSPYRFDIEDKEVLPGYMQEEIKNNNLIDNLPLSYVRFTKK